MVINMINGYWRWVAIAFLIAFLFMGIVRKVSASEVEQESWVGIRSLAGTFEQRIFDSNGKLVSEDSGEFSVLKPHYLRWFVTVPGRQLLVVNGEYLWQYDFDLETGSRQPISASQQSPLKLLIETEEALLDDYTVSRKNNTMTLRPNNKNHFFQLVTVEFSTESKSEVPTRMKFIDNLNQTVDVQFIVDTNILPKPEDFRFEAPDGGDINFISN